MKDTRGRSKLFMLWSPNTTGGCVEAIVCVAQQAVENDICAFIIS